MCTRHKAPAILWFVGFSHFQRFPPLPAPDFQRFAPASSSSPFCPPPLLPSSSSCSRFVQFSQLRYWFNLSSRQANCQIFYLGRFSKTSQRCETALTSQFWTYIELLKVLVKQNGGNNFSLALQVRPVTNSRSPCIFIKQIQGFTSFGFCNFYNEDISVLNSKT